MASSREGPRQQKIPQGSHPQEEAVNPHGPEGAPSPFPAQTEGLTCGEQRYGLMGQVVGRKNMSQALDRVEQNKGAAGVEAVDHTSWSADRA